MSKPETPRKETQPPPRSETEDKSSIRASQEEFIDDEAVPSRDRKEVDTPAPRPAAAAEDGSNKIKDPHNWTTGGEPATGAQLSYLKTLSEEAGVAFDDAEQVTKADASQRIDALRQRSPRVHKAE